MDNNEQNSKILLSLEHLKRTEENKNNNSTVYLGDLISQPLFLTAHKDEMVVPMGINDAGEVVYDDISSFHHTLIGGTAGSGKTVFLNTVIVSLLYRYTPEELNFILIDPKMVELSQYENLPHLVLPIAYTYEQATSSLKWAIEENKRRLELLEKFETISIFNYNHKIESGEINAETLSSIVIIIDEMADLMLDEDSTFKDNFIELISNTEQSGIYVLSATQLLDSKVILPDIKDYMPKRIAFRSITSGRDIGILDHSGAETLLSKGEMIFADLNEENHLQGAYVSQQEIKAVVDACIEQYKENPNNNNTDINNKEAKIDKKQLQKNYLKILIQLIVSSFIYLIASSCDKFSGINSSVDVKNIVILDYAKYIMYFTYFITLISIFIFILKICKKELPKPKINLNTLYNILDWVILLPICISLATFCFTFVFTFTSVHGNSMNPNINEGDRLLVTYPSEYERFDVVVVKVDPSYKSVAETDLYLKRIIGLPGEYIDYRFENGITQLYINGQRVSEDFYTETELRKYLTYNTSRSSEQFEWSERCFIDGGNSPVKQCEKFEGHYIIPEGYYFVLGDNRPISKDSRDIGLVKEKDIIGMTEYIMNEIFKPTKID